MPRCKRCISCTLKNWDLFRRASLSQSSKTSGYLPSLMYCRSGDMWISPHLSASIASIATCSFRERNVFPTAYRFISLGQSRYNRLTAGSLNLRGDPQIRGRRSPYLRGPQIYMAPDHEVCNTQLISGSYTAFYCDWQLIILRRSRKEHLLAGFPISMANEIVEACREGDLEKVKNLVEQCDVNPKDPQWKDAGKTPLHWASHYGRLEVVKYLVENCKCDPMCKDAEYGKTPLHWASHYGRLEVMKYLVASLRCDPMCKDDKWGNTPLHWAARFATLEAVKYLVDDCNCDVMCTNNQNNSPLNDAALGGNLEVVRFLITEKKCDPRVTGRWGRTPLHYACEVSSIAVVKFLLEESGYKEPSCRDDIGLTPLHVAASQGSLDIVKYLIEEQKCKIECKDDHDETPLHEAIKGGRFGIMKYLIRNGCDPMRGGKSGGTALHHACQHGRVEEVKHLIAHNNLAIDSPCNNSGASPLHVAAANGRLDIVKLLVETFLCELNVQDSNKQTPLELAQEKGEDEIASYLSDLDKKSKYTLQKILS